eukprot:g17887.t1
MSIRTLTNFYRSTTESIQSGCTRAWYGNCSAQDRQKLKKVACTARTTMEADLPSMDSIYTSYCCENFASIIKNPSQCSLPNSSVRQKIQKLEHTHQQVQEQL